MLQSNEPNIFAREIFYGISFVGTGLKKKRAVRVTGEHARVWDSIEPRGQGWVGHSVSASPHWHIDTGKGGSPLALAISSMNPGR
jgi:hypothetical protein